MERTGRGRLLTAWFAKTAVAATMNNKHFMQRHHQHTASRGSGGAGGGNAVTKMQWSECNNNNNSQTPHDPYSRHQATTSNNNTNNNTNSNLNMSNNNNISAAPTIKNHSVTHFSRYLYCFGGYDGVRNHMTLLLYDLQGRRWILPLAVAAAAASCSNNNNEEVEEEEESTRQLSQKQHHPHNHQQQNHPKSGDRGSAPPTTPIMEEGGSQTDSQRDYDNSLTRNNDLFHPQEQRRSVKFPNIDAAHSSNSSTSSTNSSNSTNSTTNVSTNNNSHSSNTTTNNNNTIIVLGTPPPGRNGHSATLVANDDGTGRIFIIGGWLGTGPFAASDMHILNVSHGGQVLRWSQPINNKNDDKNGTVHSDSGIGGTPPGPCNMHSADFVPNNQEIYVFRGGNGREYLNDLHALHVHSLTWRSVATTGTVPQQRANHSSAMLLETSELFIFGGWNGTERLNDIHILDIITSTWTWPKIRGVLPHPRAGMTLTALRGRLYLFGGSGTSAKCFQDLQILDRQEMAWLDVSSSSDSPFYENTTQSNNNSNMRLDPQQQQRQKLRFSSHQNNLNPYDDPDFLFGEGSSVNLFDNNMNGMVDEQTRNSSSRRLLSASGSSFDNVNDAHQFDYSDHAAFQDDANARNGSGANMAQESRFSDWKSRHMALERTASSSSDIVTTNPHHRHMYDDNQYHNSLSPNPNDEDTISSVLLHGQGPGRRAGHTATAVNRFIYVFGGSCGADYLNDFFVLDTEPPPQAIVTEPTSLHLFERRLRHFFNDEEFADVTFLVQGQKVYGHKMVLSIVSDCFRAMFTTGFRESEEMEIEIPDCSHRAFLSVMEYIYTGALPNIDLIASSALGDDNSSNNGRSIYNPYRVLVTVGDRKLTMAVEMLQLSDRFFLDHLKQICECKLQAAVNIETVEYLLSVALKSNASQLQNICEHVQRNFETTTMTTMPAASAPI